MCPMRFILVFFSALLAVYLAWKTACSSLPPQEIEEEEEEEEAPATLLPKISHSVSQNAFRVFIDMATGTYLWRNLKKINTNKPCLQ